MQRPICVTSTVAAGGTFLEWSINYLAGRSKYFRAYEGEIVLVSNPLTNVNAHNHRKNHPSGLIDTCAVVNELQNNTKFASLYPYPLAVARAATLLGLDIQNITPSQWEQVCQCQSTDYNRMLQWLADKSCKIVYISTDSDLSVYFYTTIRWLDQLLSNNKSFETSAEWHTDLDQVFFQTSCNQWNDLKLTSIWDIRERRALSTRPLECVTYNIDLSVPHYWLDCRDFWFNCEEKIKDIMSWLGITIDHTRVKHWQHVHSEWKQKVLKGLEFQHQYKHIVEAIVKGWSFPINLTFDQEVVIQHCLIYQHNLNLKTWQLEKFPNNTLDLHALLETNIHPLV